MNHKKWIKKIAQMGGKARADKLTPGRRREIAKMGHNARIQKKLLAIQAEASIVRPDHEQYNERAGWRTPFKRHSR